ncbi:MAG: hypothetical protein AMXMBFR33_24010 [Candidatus Xenobia bacterium]
MQAGSASKVRSPGLGAPEATGDFFYFITDGTGSVRLVVDEAGDVAAEYDADEFGNPFTPGGSDPTVSDQKWLGGLGLKDEVGQTGLYYVRQRFYDPTLGRFISRDPIGFRGGLNRYVYARNNPINRVDPSGLAAFFYGSSDAKTELVRLLRAYSGLNSIGWDPNDSDKLIIGDEAERTSPCGNKLGSKLQELTSGADVFYKLSPRSGSVHFGWHPGGGPLHEIDPYDFASLEAIPDVGMDLAAGVMMHELVEGTDSRPWNDAHPPASQAENEFYNCLNRPANLKLVRGNDIPSGTDATYPLGGINFTFGGKPYILGFTGSQGGLASVSWLPK